MKQHQAFQTYQARMSAFVNAMSPDRIEHLLSLVNHDMKEFSKLIAEMVGGQ